jgi:PAS domain S-box-containing protein
MQPYPNPAPSVRHDESDLCKLAETMSSLIALVRDGRFVFVNRAGGALLGRSPEWFCGRTYQEIVHQDDRAMAIARGTAPALGTGLPQRLVERLLHSDGSTIWLDCAIDVLRLDGRPTTIVTGNDITAHRRVEEALRRSEARLAEAQRIGNIGSWEWDVENDLVVWSDELCRLFGATPRDFGARIDGYLRFVHADDRDAADAVLRQALAHGSAFAFEHRIVRPDGTVRTLFGRGQVFRDAGGRPVRIAGTGQDVTEQKRMQQELQQSEERFRNLCTQAPVMLLAFAPDGRIREVSNYWLQTTGYARDEVIGREGRDFVTADSYERLLQAAAANKQDQDYAIRQVPLQGVCKDGNTIDLLCTSVVEVDDRGQKRGAICVQINLTDLQRAEAALRESEERYRALVEHAPEAIMVLDVELDRFVDANAHAEKLFGFSREKLLSMGPLDFCPDHQANQRKSCDMLADEHDRVLAGETAVFEFTHVDATGREIVCETRLSRLPAAGRKLIRATMSDVSELRQLQEKVRHAEKLAAVGVLAAGVAHEIGNPLMALSTAAQSLERRSCDDYARSKMALIREHIDRIARIVRQMSDLARPPSGQRARTDLNQVVRRAVDMVRYDRRARGVTVDYELAHLPAVEIVEDELAQVCINLALNAFDAMAGNPPERPARLLIRSAVTATGVAVAFHDTGPGVPPEVRDKVFQPFFTTKDVGSGSGLGLSVSYRILQEHRGSLRLGDTDGAGAAFVFELPLGEPA